MGFADDVLLCENHLQVFQRLCLASDSTYCFKRGHRPERCLTAEFEAQSRCVGRRR